jgi:hypothetical protein
MIRFLLGQLRWRSMLDGLFATLILAALIVIGSRNLADFDSALIGYTFACLFMTFGIVYRYSVWLSKPPTRKYWLRGWQILFQPKKWPAMPRSRIMAGAVWSRIVIQDFVFRRGVWRWSGHMLIAWGTLLAFAVTFPLVFGWIHFEQGAIAPVATYYVYFFGFRMREIPVAGIESWFALHALVIAAFMVIAGVIIVMYRRMVDKAALSVQRFGRDLLPLVLLFAVSMSGLLLWVSYKWLEGYYYGALAQFHAISVIALLISLPFGKLFHVVQRPASLGVAYYRQAGERGEQAVCDVTGEEFAPRLQTEDLNEVLPELGFDYEAPQPDAPNWNEISPEGRRRLIGRAHDQTRRGKFD